MKFLTITKGSFLVALVVLSFTCRTSQAQMGPPPGTYKITSGERSVTIPFRLLGTYVLLTAEIDGVQTGLVLDTGMPANGVLLHARSEGDLYGFESAGQVGVMGASGDLVMADILSGLKINLPGLVLEGQSAIIMPYAPERDLVFTREGMPGVIGLSLFGQFVVEIDYDKQVVVLTEPDSYRPPENAEVVPLTFGHTKVPQIACTVQTSDGDTVPLDVVIDCGHARALALAAGEGAAIDLPEGSIETRIGIGATGALMGHVGRVPALTVGSHTFKDVVASFKRGDEGGPMVGGKEGNLGAEILSRFKVTFDYTNEKMFLEPGERIDEPFEHDMSGIEISRLEDGSFAVDLVISESPADEAGLTTEDVILEMDGRAAGEIGRTELRDMMKREGEEIVLVVERNGKKREVTLTLRRLI